MRSHLNGKTTTPVVMAVGVWNPLFPEHVHLLQRLRNRAHDLSCSSLLVVLHPDPVRLCYGPAHWPVYNDPNVSTRLIMAYGIDAVIRMRLSQRDLEAGPEDLFTAVSQYACITELWLGATQTLGRGEKGTVHAISGFAERSGFRVVQMDRSGPGLGWHLRQLIAAGCLRPAIELVGRPPIWCRPRSGRVRLAWGQGVYRAAPVSDLLGKADNAPMDIRLLPERNGVSSFAWPDPRLRYLAFLSGPNETC